LKTFEGPRQLRWRRKRTEEGRMLIQNKCVSSQNHRYKKRRGRYRSGVTYLLFGETVRAGLVRAGRAAILHGDIQLFTGNPHKIPLMSYLRRETPAIFRLQLIDSPKQMNKYKDADESDKNISDLKHKNVNVTNNNCS
jgi:hypothetical protein